MNGDTYKPSPVIKGHRNSLEPTHCIISRKSNGVGSAAQPPRRSLKILCRSLESSLAHQSPIEANDHLNALLKVSGLIRLVKGQDWVSATNRNLRSGRSAVESAGLGGASGGEARAAIPAFR